MSFISPIAPIPAVIQSGTTPTFQMLNGESGIANISQNITLQGSTVVPDLVFEGKNASASGWTATVGSDLDLESGTAPTYNKGTPLLDSSDESVLFNDGGRFEHSSASLGDIDTEDFLIRVIFKYKNDGSTQRIIDTRGSGSVGWRIYIHSGGTLRFLMRTGGTNKESSTSGLIENGWYDFIIACDRDYASGLVAFANGALQGTDDASTHATSLESSDPVAIGAESGGGNPFTSNLAYIGMWRQAAWFNGATSFTSDVATFAADEHAKLTGMYPSKFKGSATPNTSTRAFAAHLDKLNSANKRRYFLVGGEWLRQCKRIDSDANTFAGYLSELQKTNLFTYSHAMTNWTELDAGDVTADDQEVAPNGETEAATLKPDSTDGEHGWTDNPTLTAATYSFSVHVKKGAQQFVLLDNGTISNGGAWFDLDTGAVGTEEAGVTAYIEGPFDGTTGDFYRCCIVFTGTAAAHTLGILACDADNDRTISSGDGSTVGISVWGAQVEQSDYMTSPINTTGSTATRVKDQLQFSGTTNVADSGTGAVAADVLFSNYDNAVTPALFELSDGGASADRIQGSVTAADIFAGTTRATAGSDGDVTVAGDVVSGAAHDVRLRWGTNNLVARVDSTDGTADTSVGVPDAIDEIDLGSDLSGGNQPGCLIRNFRIYGKSTTAG